MVGVPAKVPVALLPSVMTVLLLPLMLMTLEVLKSKIQPEFDRLLLMLTVLSFRSIVKLPLPPLKSPHARLSFTVKVPESLTTITVVMVFPLDVIAVFVSPTKEKVAAAEATLLPTVSDPANLSVLEKDPV